MILTSLHIAQGKIERIEDRYDADNDLIPDAPVVTWADNELAQMVKILIGHIDTLYSRIAALEGEEEISYKDCDLF